MKGSLEIRTGSPEGPGESPSPPSPWAQKRGCSLLKWSFLFLCLPLSREDRATFVQLNVHGVQICFLLKPREISLQENSKDSHSASRSESRMSEEENQHADPTEGRRGLLPDRPGPAPCCSHEHTNSALSHRGCLSLSLVVKQKEKHSHRGHHVNTCK